MANRARRRHTTAHLNDSVLNPGINPTQQINSRYDMSFPQNWTVSQLRAELEQNNISFNKADKKSRLIQLCREHGLINEDSGTTGDEETNKQVDLSILEELQKTVQILSGNVQKLMENSGAAKQNPSVPNVDTTSAISHTQTQQNTQVPITDTMTSISSTLPRVTYSLMNNTGTFLTSDNSPLDVHATNRLPSILTPVDPTNTVLAGHSNTMTMNNITNGVPTRFGYSAESLSFVERIHPSIRKQITEGKDVNLAALLIPYYTGPHANPSTTSKEKPDPRLNNTLTLAQFIQAFGIYKSIMCESYPLRRLELDLYERDIVDM